MINITLERESTLNGKLKLFATRLLQSWARYVRMETEAGTEWTSGSAGEQAEVWKR